MLFDGCAYQHFCCAAAVTAFGLVMDFGRSYCCAMVGDNADLTSSWSSSQVSGGCACLTTTAQSPVVFFVGIDIDSDLFPPVGILSVHASSDAIFF
jgi:hypothetical protein